MSELSSHASLDLASRLRKAGKIERVIGELSVPIEGRMLEVGAGSGYISEYFGKKYARNLQVDAVDVIDQRVVSDHFFFQEYDGQRLPFEDGCFNLVVSNHVIEHVGSREAQEAHLGELARVLSPRGSIYLAAPSRWQVIEPHFRLAGLSWLPSWMRDTYVRLAGKGECYDCNPMGHRELEKMARRIGMQARNVNAYALKAYCAESHSFAGRWLAILPKTWVEAVYRASPTMVYFLTHEVDEV